jgi:hypothetical protein
VCALTASVGLGGGTTVVLDWVVLTGFGFGKRVLSLWLAGSYCTETGVME